MVGVGEDVRKDLHVEVGDTDALAKPLVNKTFHTLPKHMHGHFGIGEEVVRPVKVVEVDVVGLEGGETLPESGLWVKVGIVPQLGRQEDLISFDGARGDGRLETLAHLSFVHCDSCRVDVSVADTGDCMLDSLGVLVEQSAQAHHWHLAPV